MVEPKCPRGCAKLGITACKVSAGRVFSGKVTGECQESMSWASLCTSANEAGPQKTVLSRGRGPTSG